MANLTVTAKRDIKAHQKKLAMTFRTLHQSLEKNGVFEALEQAGKRAGTIFETLEKTKFAMPDMDRLRPLIESVSKMAPKIEVPKMESHDLALSLTRNFVIPHPSRHIGYPEIESDGAGEIHAEPKSQRLEEKLMFDCENRILKWKGKVFHSFMSAKFPRRLMELAFVEGHGHKVPISAFSKDEYKADDIREGVRNFAKLIKAKAKEHKIPLGLFGDFIIRKPSNYILISPLFVEG